MKILWCKNVDGYRIESGFAANLAADNFLVKFSIQNSKYKIEITIKFKTYMLEANWNFKTAKIT